MNPGDSDENFDKLSSTTSLRTQQETKEMSTENLPGVVLSDERDILALNIKRRVLPTLKTTNSVELNKKNLNLNKYPLLLYEKASIKNSKNLFNKINRKISTFSETIIEEDENKNRTDSSSSNNFNNKCIKVNGLNSNEKIVITKKTSKNYKIKNFYWLTLLFLLSLLVIISIIIVLQLNQPKIESKTFLPFYQTVATTSTTDLKTASNKAYSIARYILITDLLNQGYSIVYNYTYSHDTTLNELININSTCNQNTTICVAGAPIGSNALSLISCGLCLPILKQTQLNQPMLTNGAYWYLTPGYSFGFSSTSIIEQYSCDISDIKSEEKLCWHLNKKQKRDVTFGGQGGWRLGSLVNLNSDLDHIKYVFLLNMVTATILTTESSAANALVNESTLITSKSFNSETNSNLDLTTLLTISTATKYLISSITATSSTYSWESTLIQNISSVSTLIATTSMRTPTEKIQITTSNLKNNISTVFLGTTQFMSTTLLDRNIFTNSSIIIVNIFYPFGLSQNDSVLEIGDDVLSSPINLNSSFLFFDKHYSTIYVSSNGLLKFDRYLNDWILVKFPDKAAIIAPFWSDINTINGGSIYYREEIRLSVLSLIDSDINLAFPNLRDFKSIWAFIATWSRVATFGGSASELNSFQATLATNGTVSFLLFNYGNLMWPNQFFKRSVQCGYDAGDGLNYFLLDKSFDLDVTNMNKYSNVNMSGKYIFRVDTGIVQSKTEIVSLSTLVNPSTVTSTTVATSLLNNGSNPTDSFTEDSTFERTVTSFSESNSTSLSTITTLTDYLTETTTKYHSLNGSTQTTIFYPFGLTANDSVLEKSDETLFGPFNLTDQFIFFNKTYSSIYINTNGVVTFSKVEINFHPQKFPLNITLISPFWSDINTFGGGNIFYREEINRNILNLIDYDINLAYPFLNNYESKSSFIVTWHEVASYTSYMGERTSFQVALTSNGTISFLIYNYDLMDWPNISLNASVEAGFDSGDGFNYLILNDSFTNDIVNISKSSNVNVLGKYIFRVDSNIASNGSTNTSLFENSVTSLTSINNSSTLDSVDSTFTQLTNEFTTISSNYTRESTAFNSTFASTEQNNLTENIFQTSNLDNVTLSQSSIETTSTAVISTDRIRSNKYIYNQSSQMTSLKSMVMNLTEKTTILDTTSSFTELNDSSNSSTSEVLTTKNQDIYSNVTESTAFGLNYTESTNYTSSFYSTSFSATNSPKAPLKIYSLAQNIQITDLLNQGYDIAYNFTYLHSTSIVELIDINSTCSQNSILCVGGAATKSNTLLLLSCGNCWSILRATKKDTPVLINGAYWYLTPGYSFGFAPNSTINQVTCDKFDTANNFRLCWHLDQNVGGWRIGSLVWFLNSDFNFVKYLFIANVTTSLESPTKISNSTVNAPIVINPAILLYYANYSYLTNNNFSSTI